MSYLWSRLLFCFRRQEPTEDDWKGEKFLVKVFSVYDGDTLTLLLKRRGKWITQKVRMTGYDTPEMKPLKSKENREEEIEKAKKARQDFISRHTEYMWLVCDGREKYGRILGRLYRTTWWGKQEKESINDWMIKNSFATPYNGGKKEEW